MPRLLTPTSPSHFLKPEQRHHLHSAYKEAEGPRLHNKSCYFNNPAHLLCPLPPLLFCSLLFCVNSPSLGGYTFLAVSPSPANTSIGWPFQFSVSIIASAHTHTLFTAQSPVQMQVKLAPINLAWIPKCHQVSDILFASPPKRKEERSISSLLRSHQFYSPLCAISTKRPPLRLPLSEPHLHL